MKNCIALIFILSLYSTYAQNVFDDNKAWRAEQNKEFSDSATSPLTNEARANFDSLPYFPISEVYAVTAYLELTPASKPFKMKTSTDRLADYRQFGIAHFNIKGEDLKIPVFQNLSLLKNPKYKNYLFIPFTDLTNSVETYSGGRYVEAEIPEGDSLLIDFNKAYNPYCAYNDRYSCPIPPSESHLEARIEAGVLYNSKKEKKSKNVKKPKASVIH